MKKGFFRKLPWGVVCLLVLQSAGWAQEDDITKSYVYEDSVVIYGERISEIPKYSSVGMKFPVPILETPASISVVNHGLIMSQRGTILGDALKNTSGVNVQTGFGVHDYFVVRGFGSLENGLVLTDGIFEPEATFFHMYNVERVEVLKGPGAFLYGGNPLAGTVNLSRKQPLFKNFVHATGSFGTYNTFRGAVDVGSNNQDLGVAFRLNAFAQKSDNYRDDTDHQTWAVNPSVTWLVTPRSQLTLNVEYVKNEYTSDSGIPLLFDAAGGLSIPDVSRKNSYQSPFDRNEQQIYRIRLDYEHRVNDRWTIREKMYYTDFDWPSVGTLFNGAFQIGNDTLVDRQFLTLDDHQKVLGNQLEATASFDGPWFSGQAVLGVETNRLTDEFILDVARSTVGGIDLVNPVEPLNDPSQLSTVLGSAGDATTYVVAPFAVGRVKFSDQLQGFLGGRFDYIDYEDDRIESSFDASLFSLVLTDTSVSRSYKQFSPVAGLLYRPVENASVYVSFGSAFAPPSTLTLGDLKAEKSTQFEVGSKQQFRDGRITTTIAFYFLQKSNIAVATQNGLKQTGDQESKGIEFEIMAQPMRNWQVFGSYAYNDAELTEFSEFVFDPGTGQFVPVDYSGNRPLFAPEHIMNLWTTREFKNRIGIGGGARYVSSHFIAPDNAFKLDGHLLLDATVFYTFKSWKWSVNFKNLTNEEYEMRSGTGSNSVLPANPFEIHGTVEFAL